MQTFGGQWSSVFSCCSLPYSFETMSPAWKTVTGVWLGCLTQRSSSLNPAQFLGYRHYIVPDLSLIFSFLLLEYGQTPESLEYVMCFVVSLQYYTLNIQLKDALDWSMGAFIPFAATQTWNNQKETVYYNTAWPVSSCFSFASSIILI